MRFITTMRGQPVTVIYGANASGLAVDAQVELADGGPAELTDAEQRLALDLAIEHNTLVQQSSRFLNTPIEFLPDGAFPGKPWVLSVKEDGCTTPIDWFATFGEALEAQKSHVTEGGAA